MHPTKRKALRFTRDVVLGKHRSRALDDQKDFEAVARTIAPLIYQLWEVEDWLLCTHATWGDEGAQQLVSDIGATLRDAGRR